MLCRCRPGGLGATGWGWGKGRLLPGGLGTAPWLLAGGSRAGAQRRALRMWYSGFTSWPGLRQGPPTAHALCPRSLREGAIWATLLGASQAPRYLHLHVPCVRTRMSVCTRVRVLMHVCTRLFLHLTRLCAFARTHTCACAYVCYVHTGAYTRVRVRGEQGAESGTAAGGGAARCGRVGMDGTPCSVSVDAASPWPSGHVPWAALRSLDPELGRGRLSAGLARRRRAGCAPGRGPCPAVAGLCSPLGRAGVTGARPAPSVSAGRTPGPGLPRAGQADGSLGAPSEQGTAGWASPGLLHGRGRVARGSQWTVVGCAGQGAPSEATSLSVPAGEPGVCLTTHLFTFLAQRLRTLSGWGGRGLPR